MRPVIAAGRRRPAGLRQLLMAFAAGGLLSGAQAAEPAPVPWVAGQPLSAEQAAALALQRSSATAAAEALAQVARGQAGTTALLDAPVLKVTADRDQPQTGSAAKPVRSKFELSWSPPQVGELGLKREQLARLADQAEGQGEVARQRTALQAHQLHATLVALQQLEGWSQQARALQADLVATAERQAAAGRRTRQELLEVAHQQAVLDSAAEDLQDERAAVRRQLLALMGQPDDTALQVPARQGPYVAASAGADGLDRVALALRLRPEAQAADARCAALEADTRLKALDNGRWLKSVATTYSPRSGDRAPNIGLQVELTLPVTGDRHGSAAMLEAQRRACAAEREDLAQQLQQQVRDAEAQLMRASRAARLQLRQLATFQGALGLTQAARAAARADEAELLAAQLAVVQGHQLVVRRLLEAELADLALQQATGTLLPGARAGAPATVGRQGMGQSTRPTAPGWMKPANS